MLCARYTYSKHNNVPLFDSEQNEQEEQEVEGAKKKDHSSPIIIYNYNNNIIL